MNKEIMNAIAAEAQKMFEETKNKIMTNMENIINEADTYGVKMDELDKLLETFRAKAQEYAVQPDEEADECEGCPGCDGCMEDRDVTIIGDGPIDVLADSYREVNIAFNDVDQLEDRIKVVVSHDDCLEYDKVLIALIEAMIAVVVHINKDSKVMTKEEIENLMATAIFDMMLDMAAKMLSKAIKK